MRRDRTALLIEIADATVDCDGDCTSVVVV